jgi:hypothetical protein
MAIRFQFDDETWEADTVEEAIALRAKLQYSTRFGPDPHKEMDKLDRLWTPDRFTSVIEGVGEMQKRFLIALQQHPGISSEELTKELGLNSEVALAGVISGLSKQLKQLSIEPKEVFLIDVKWAGKKKKRTFLLDDFFLGIGSSLAWPEGWTEESNTRTA